MISDQKNVPKRSQLMQETMPSLLRLIHGFKYVFEQSKDTSQQTTMLQIQVLGLLYVYPNSTAKDIGDALYLSSSATTQLLQRLFEAEWIQRENDMIDRRSIRLSLTDKGSATLQEYRSTNVSKIGNIFSVLTDAELEAFVSTLKKLNDTIKENKDANK